MSNMAGNAYDETQLSYTKKLRRLQELFHGRFSKVELIILLEKHDEDLHQTVGFVLQAESKDLRDLLEAERQKWTTVQRRRQLKSQRPDILDLAKDGRINFEVRQFACAPCDSFWWRKVPCRKQVSQCKRCRQRFEPVPRHLEWGWADFQCLNCHRNFQGWGQMTRVWSPCYECGHPVFPSKIYPPKKKENQDQVPGNPDMGLGDVTGGGYGPGTGGGYGPGTGGGYGPGIGAGYIVERVPKNTHCCAAPDCFGRQQYRGHAPIGQVPGDGILTCVHPMSRRQNGLPQVVKASNIHDSSGSTVNTFLTQEDLDDGAGCLDAFTPPLASIREEDWGDDGSLNPGDD